MDLSKIPDHLYSPKGVGEDRMFCVYYDRYIVFQIKPSDDIIYSEEPLIFTGKDNSGNFLWRVFDGNLNEYVSTGYIGWKYSNGNESPSK